MTPAPLPDPLKEEWPGAVVASGETAFFTFVALSSSEAVRDYVPDLGAIAATGAQALLLTAAAAPGRVPTTCCGCSGPTWASTRTRRPGRRSARPGPFWAGRLGRDYLVARQLSRRGALLYVHVVGDRVGIAGSATTVLTGHLC